MKKLLLGLMLLVGLTGFSQSKLLYVYNSGDSQGIEFTHDLDAYGAKEHPWEIGFGLTGCGDLNTGYLILGQKITKYVTLAGKVGGYSSDRCCGDNAHIYYGGTTYLQLNGDKEGFILGMGVDNIHNLTVGLGYKF